MGNKDGNWNSKHGHLYVASLWQFTFYSVFQRATEYQLERGWGNGTTNYINMLILTNQQCGGGQTESQATGAKNAEELNPRDTKERTRSLNL